MSRQQFTTVRPKNKQESLRASLCALGHYVQRTNFLAPLSQHLKIAQKRVKYTPVENLTDCWIGILCGARALSHTNRTVRVDRQLQKAFGRSACAEQSTIADTLDACTFENVAQLRAAVEEIYQQHGRAVRHDFGQGLLRLDIDLSPMPTSARAEGATRGYFGRSRSKTGRKLVRVLAPDYQEIVYERIAPGNLSSKNLAALKSTVLEMERILNLDTRQKRGQVELRLDSGFGTTAIINWVLSRGYQLLTKMAAWQRVRKLAAQVEDWLPTSSVGREVGVVPRPVRYARKTHQYAVRTPSEEKEGGYQYAVLVTTLLDLSPQEAVDEYDGRARIESEIQQDKAALGLVKRRKKRLAAQEMLLLLVELAHNFLVWMREELAKVEQRLARFGLVRLVDDLWAIPGRVIFAGNQLRRIQLERLHPHTKLLLPALSALLGESVTLQFLG